MTSHSELPLFEVIGGQCMDSLELLEALNNLSKRLEEMEEWALLTDLTRIQESIKELIGKVEVF